ncbi:MAG: TlpA family protein disulfide reductase [Phycisphaerales bacterium]|nr:TlpA family protein disulfide reductase [Phycisphaerales bacterium]
MMLPWWRIGWTVVVCSMCVLAGNAVADERVDSAISDVLAKLAAHDILQFEVEFEQTADGKSQPPVGLEVAMDRKGRFSVRATQGGNEIGGIVGDSEQIIEWDSKARSWTRYPASDQLAGTEHPRLIKNLPDSVHLTVALSYHMGSWLCPRSPMEWLLQRIQTIGGTDASTSTETIDGKPRRIIQAKKTMQEGPFKVTEEVRAVFDAASLLPLSIETIASLPGSKGALDRLRYKVVAGARPPSFDWKSPEGYSFVAPETLRPVKPALIGQSVSDWEVSAVDGEQILLVPEKATKPTLIILWATWCLSCKVEIDAVKKLLDDGKLKDLRVLCVSIDSDEDAMRKMLTTKPLPFPVAHDANFLGRVGARGVPTSIVINSKGVVTAMWTGWGGGDDAIKQLKEALDTAK